MALTLTDINVGTVAGDGTGDTARVGGQAINANNALIETAVDLNTAKLTCDETNVKAALDGATITAATVAGTDKILGLDADDTDNLKTYTAQSIADLASGGVANPMTADLGLGGYKLTAAATTDAIVKLADNAGTYALSIQDSDSAERMYIDSDGVMRIINTSGAYAQITGTSGNRLSVSNGIDISGHITLGTGWAFLDGSTAGTTLRTLRGNQTIDIGNGSQPASDVAVGALTITGQRALAAATTNIIGGGITVTGGAGASSSVGLAHGGDVTVQGGTGYGTGDGGAITLTGGVASGSGAVGVVAIDSTTLLEMDKTTQDAAFMNFKATADADATSAISTHTTSGSTTHHIQIEINGTTAWIAASTTDPTA